MRLLNNMPSSVISSHSMHLGVLATASHAINTGTLFSVFYKPRYLTIHYPYFILSGVPLVCVRFFIIECKMNFSYVARI